MLRSTRLAGLAVALAAAAPALAQVPTLQTCLPDDPCPTLTLDEVLALVEDGHPAVRSARLETDVAEAEVLGARGGFDPYLATGYDLKTDGFDDKLNLFESSLVVPVDAPFSPALVVNHRVGEGPAIDPSDATSALGETRVGVSFSPLGGRSTDARRTALAQARLAPRAAQAYARAERNDVVLDARQAYWSWAGAAAKAAVREELLEAARQRAAFVVRRVGTGAAAPVDSLEARLAVVRREGDLVGALREAETAGVELGTFLWGPDGEPVRLRAAPTSLPELPAPEGLPDAAAAFDVATANRPELERAAVRIETAQLGERLARQDLLPNVRLSLQTVSYGSAPGDFGNVKVGVSLAQPLLFRPGRARLAEAEVTTRRRDLERDLVAREVEAEVEAALATLRRAADRVALAEEQADLAAQLQQAEARRFELGEGTLFLVNQREQALAEARLTEIEARVAYLQAYAVFLWTTGQI